jgi:hypothetical protein
MVAEGTYEFGDTFQHHALAVLARIPGGVVRYRSALDHTYFGSKQLRIVSEALFKHVDVHRKLPQQPTLLEDVRDVSGDDDFPGVRRVVSRLYKEDISDARAVLERLIEFGKQQAFVNATLKAADKLDRGDRNLRPLFDEAALVGEDLLDVGIDYAGSPESRLEWYRNPQVQAADQIRTGVPHLDAMLGGGIARGGMGVVLAPPKRGKTTTLINIGFGALTAVSRYNVVHYSMEMDQDRVSRRYDDRLMGEKVQLRKSDPDRYAELLEARLKKTVRGRLFVKNYPTRTATVSKLRSHLSLLSARAFHPDVIIVDYADIMKPERRLGEMRHEQAGIYEDLRQLAGEFNAVVWTGSQASRGALEKDVITINDFAETFEKAAIVDAAIAFCQTDDERIERKCRLFGAALRDQEDGRTVECEIHRNQCRIRSISLLDVAGTRIVVDGVDDKREDYTETRTEVVRKKAVETIKDRAGLRRKKAVKREARPVARKKFSTKKGGKRVAERRDRPTRKVEAA